MGASESGANRALNGAVTGDMWVGIALDADRDLVSVVEADETYVGTPRVLVPGGATGWFPAASREITARGDTDHGDALQDFTPQFWILWSAATGGDPLFSRRVSDTTVRTGDAIVIPSTTIRLLYDGYINT